MCSSTRCLLNAAAARRWVVEPPGGEAPRSSCVEKYVLQMCSSAAWRQHSITTRNTTQSSVPALKNSSLYFSNGVIFTESTACYLGTYGGELTEKNKIKQAKKLNNPWYLRCRNDKYQTVAVVLKREKKHDKLWDFSIQWVNIHSCGLINYSNNRVLLHLINHGTSTSDFKNAGSKIIH